MLRKSSLTLSLLLVVVVPLLLFGAGSSRADDRDYGRNGGAVNLLAIVPIPTSDRGTPLVPLRAFDISWVDQATQLYYLGDRSNKSVDVVDAKTNTFVRHITGGFTGVVFNANNTANNDKSGPNGVLVFGPPGRQFLIVTDAPSRVVSINLNNDTIVNPVVFTGGTDAVRADELAFDPQDGLLLVVNNADSPPFATLIKVNQQTGVLTQPQNKEGVDRITFTDATNGAEQPAWDPKTRRFYISIPEVNGPGGTGRTGAVKRINPHTATVEATFLVQDCQPAGLTLGPNQDLLLGCSVVFDTAGNVWDKNNPNSIAAPMQIILDAKTGEVDATVKGVGGSDEVWFNPGDGRYYTASRNNPPGPVLGVIDAERQTLVQIVPTINTAGNTVTATRFPAGTAHSVAVDSRNNHALVPLPANNVFLDPNDASRTCSNGCIAVFGTPNGGDRD